MFPKIDCLMEYVVQKRLALVSFPSYRLRIQRPGKSLCAKKSTEFWEPRWLSTAVCPMRFNPLVLGI